MLHALFGDLESPLRLGPWTVSAFHYITFRAALAGVAAFAIGLWLGPRVIRWLRERRVQEATGKTDTARIAELHRAKASTPTIGGLILIGAFAGAVLLLADCTNRFVWVGLLLAAALGGIGFLDDWIKLRDPVRKGMSARAKFWGVLLSGAAAGAVLVWLAPHADDTVLALPFAKYKVFPLGWGYVPLMALVVCATSNAVNLTDGLDGLASGCSIIAALALGVLAYAVGHRELADYLYLPYRPGAGEGAVLCTALAGATLAFLWYNAPPAQIFMGDTGSLPLGGMLGYAAVVAHQELLLPLLGGIFVAEAGSVILQVASFQLTGRRIFRISPLHHHFEDLGLPETKIVIRFWVVAAVLAVLTVATLKIR